MKQEISISSDNIAKLQFLVFDNKSLNGFMNKWRQIMGIGFRFNTEYVNPCINKWIQVLSRDDEGLIDNNEERQIYRVY